MKSQLGQTLGLIGKGRGPEPACLQGSHFLVCWKCCNEILQSYKLINKFISPVFRGEHYKTKAQAGSVSGTGLFSG